jgi:hypothetical protein
LDPHVGSCIGASREKARELDLVRSEVARERGREFRHLGPRELTGKLFKLASSEVARERGSDSAEVPREVTGVDGVKSHVRLGVSAPRISEVGKPKFGIASSEVASSEIPQGKVSELTDLGSRGSEGVALDCWTREVASSDPPRS